MKFGFSLPHLLIEGIKGINPSSSTKPNFKAKRHCSHSGEGR